MRGMRANPATNIFRNVCGNAQSKAELTAVRLSWIIDVRVLIRLKMAESAVEGPPGRADGSRQTVRRWTTTAVACATSVNDDDDDGSNTNHDSKDSKDSTPTSSYSKAFLAGKAAAVAREKMGQTSLALADWATS